MTKRERIEATLRRRPVDRPALAFWRHVPELDHDPARLADAMLAFHRRWDLDLIKVMSSGVYCVEDWGCRVAYTGSPNGAKQCTEHAVQKTDDWTRIRPLDPGTGALGRELEAVRLIARGRTDDAPILHTVFSPLTVARKLAGDVLDAHVHAAPENVLAALETITETVTRYALASIEAGADGIFFAMQTAGREAVSDEDYGRLERPFTRRILERIRPGVPILLLHAHGRDVRFDDLARLPVDALNWHDRLTAPTLADAAHHSTLALAGGLSESTTLRSGPAEEVSAEASDAIRQTKGLGLIVAPGCVLPLDVPDAHLKAASAAVKRSAA